MGDGASSPHGSVMSRRPVGYHPAAFAEAEGAARWYRERSPQAEAAFLAELERAVREIASGHKDGHLTFSAVVGSCFIVSPSRWSTDNAAAESRSWRSLTPTGAQVTGA